MIQELNITELLEINGGCQEAYNNGHRLRVFVDNLLLLALFF